MPEIESAQLNPQSPLALSTTSFTALGPKPERMTGCDYCFNYTTTEGRVNTIAIDPATTMNGGIVAYLGAVGGSVWKTALVSKPAFRQQALPISAQAVADACPNLAQWQGKRLRP